jgi:hypothetical protein
VKGGRPGNSKVNGTKCGGMTGGAGAAIIGIGGGVRSAIGGVIAPALPPFLPPLPPALDMAAAAAIML